ncbi:hypothetical protein BDP27DRAFT_414490 [Rhodocollybia butyracea]|uniref:Uncharacterized protein n=1 Tax=Rhodocollybia butyracea TaxID=206335 RepID=A0A9P5Q2M3_9AGAR|nr:hypothetical protein BDP27DRAFT_414490 [Rhodocollybia butyracea]
MNEVGGNVYGNSNFSSSDIYNPNGSESNIPLTAKNNQYGLLPGQGSLIPLVRSTSTLAPAISSTLRNPNNRVFLQKIGMGTRQHRLGQLRILTITHHPKTKSDLIESVKQQVLVTSQVLEFLLVFRITLGHNLLKQFLHLRLYPQFNHRLLLISTATQYASSTSHPYTPYQAQTRTQTQFVSYNNPPDQFSTPGYPSHPASPVVTAMHSPVSTPTHYAPQAYTPQHAYEPTNATYHTAMASSDSLGFPPSGHGPPPGY